MNNKYDQIWYDAMIAKGHAPIVLGAEWEGRESDIDMFVYVYDYEFCNGPLLAFYQLLRRS